MKRFVAIGLMVSAMLCGTFDCGVAHGQRRRGYGGGGGASTPAQAYAYGVGAIVRSQGQYNMMTAQAAVAAEQARQLDIQNRVAATKAYFELKQINKDYQNSKRGQASQQSMAQYYDQQKPKKLSLSQLDPVTGQIGWPVLLKDEAYQPYREQMQAIFRLWAHHQDVNRSEVLKTSAAMQAELKKHINELPPQDFEDAHKFIDALAFEAHYPAA